MKKQTSEFNMKNIYILSILFIFLTAQVAAQKDVERQLRGYTNPEEMVTLAAGLPFNQAIDLINQVSQKTTGIKIISSVESAEPIDIELVNVHYDKAMRIITQMKGFQLDERGDLIIIRGKEESVEKPEDTYASVNSREIKISAVFFEMDVAEARQRGIDWQAMFSKGEVSLGAMLGQKEQEDQQNTLEPPTFEFGGTGTNFPVGSWTGNVRAMFKFFDDEGLGELISSPNVTVRDRQKGRIQVGADFSVKQRDIAGNIVEEFFPTGTIIEVTPYIYNEEGVDYVLLDLTVERSSFLQQELTTEIRKTTSATQVLMLNGEETVIGGLFTNEDKQIRTGIPFLKDLPWWFFGIRYIAGSETTVTTKKELVILIKTELVPTLKERLAGRPINNVLETEVLRQRDRIKVYNFEDQSTTLEK
jgi:type IV pilus assembly protein PilQ